MKLKMVSLMLSVQNISDLRQLAGANEVSMSAMVRKLIREAIEKDEHLGTTTQ